MSFRIMVLAAAGALISTPAIGQVSLLVRDDMTAVLYKVNEPDTMGNVQKAAANIGGKWRPLLTNDRTCGAGAIWYASNGRERQYFIVKGRATTTEANAAAADQARAFAKQNSGFTAGALRTWVNKNAYGARTLTQKAFERVIDMDRCAPPRQDRGSIGARG